MTTTIHATTTSTQGGIAAVALGRDAGRGNLLGIQPSMEPEVYASMERFEAKIDSYLAEAARLGWIGARTVVVLPEYLATWLVAAEADPAVYAAPRVDLAMRRVVRDSPAGFARALLADWVSNRARRDGWPAGFDPTRAAVFRMKAGRMAAIYQEVFSALARRYTVTIVAGSLLLPEPTIEGGALRPGKGTLQNVSVVYRPDGRAAEQAVRKVYLIREERRFTAPGALAGLPVFDTPAGRLGVIVCADSWYPQVYAALRERQVELVAVPSYLAPAGVWAQTWQGYNPGPSPGDVRPEDVGGLTEGEAWRRYALAGRIAASGARCGVNVFLRGNLWDLGADGQSLGVRDGVVAEAPVGAGDALVNVWIP